MLMVNRLPVCEGVQQDEAVLQRRGLLVTILTLIFMINGMMHEETLWSAQGQEARVFRQREEAGD